MHLVGGVVQILDVLGGEELRSTVWSDGDGELPIVGQRRLLVDQDPARRPSGRRLCPSQRVPVGQRTSVLSAESPEGERGSAFQVQLGVDPARNGDVHPHPDFACCADIEDLSRFDLDR